MKLPAAFYSTPFAHRGLHDLNKGWPENSPAAFRAAVDHGYGIELDVQLSADGAAMVFHDYALDRLTDAKGAVRLRTADELAKIRLKGGEDTIPTLAQTLKIVAGRVPVLVEIKDQDGGMGDDLGPLEEATAKALNSYDGDIAVMSFNPHAVARMAALCPRLPRGIVTSAYRYHDWPLPKPVCDRLRGVPDYDRTGACFISHEMNDLARDRVADLRAAGAMVCCWTVRSPEAEAEARAFADNITFEGYEAPHPA